MPQLQNLILTDRTSPTPEEHTLTPRDIVNGVGTVVLQGDVPIGETRVSVGLRRANSRFHCELRFVVPTVVEETINGVLRPQILFTDYVTVKTSFDHRSTLVNRNNIIGMVQSALGADKVLIHDAMVGLEGVY